MRGVGGETVAGCFEARVRRMEGKTVQGINSTVDGAIYQSACTMVVRELRSSGSSTQSLRGGFLTKNVLKCN